jgi:predicted Zn-ribbon and HTH transcriptional regulator
MSGKRRRLLDEPLNIRPISLRACKRCGILFKSNIKTSICFGCTKKKISSLIVKEDVKNV